MVVTHGGDRSTELTVVTMLMELVERLELAELTAVETRSGHC